MLSCKLAAKHTKVRHLIENYKAVADTTVELVADFDDNLWRALVENETVGLDGD